MDFIEANGVALRCELSGKGERTLVLVHEMGGSLESWDDVAPRFAESRRVLRYDTRGAGLSQKVRGELTLDTMADDIAALLDTLRRSPARSRWRVSPSAVRSPCISRPDTRSAPAPSWSAARPPASQRSAALPALERLARIEADGMAFAVEDSMKNGYAPELRGDIKRFERFRARWLGNDPASYATIWRMLAGADMQGELSLAELSGARDRRQP